MRILNSIILFLLISCLTSFIVIIPPTSSDSIYPKSDASDLSFEALQKAYILELNSIGNIIGSSPVYPGGGQTAQFVSNLTVSQAYDSLIIALVNSARSQLAYMNSHGITLEQLRYTCPSNLIATRDFVLNYYKISSDQLFRVNTIIDKAKPYASSNLYKSLVVLQSYIAKGYNLNYTKLEVFRDATGYSDPDLYISQYSNPLDFNGRPQGLAGVKGALTKVSDITGYSIQWTDLGGVSASGSTLTKTNTTSWWNSGAGSLNVLAPGLNGWIEMTASQTNTNRMFGLSHANPNYEWNTIQYNFYLKSSATIEIYESGALKCSCGSYALNDKIKVERNGSQILFKKNDVTIYTLTTSANQSLIADVSLYTPNGTISNAKSSFGVPILTQVVWTDLVGVVMNENSLTKTNGTSWWNSGGASVNRLPVNTDGWVEMVTQGTNTYRMFGMSPTNIDAGWNTIKYNIYLRADGNVDIYESGALKCSCGTYASGDKIKVERKGTKILYKKNEVTLYSSTVSANESLIADVSLYTPNSTIYNATTNPGFYTSTLASLTVTASAFGFSLTDKDVKAISTKGKFNQANLSDSIGSKPKVASTIISGGTAAKTKIYNEANLKDSTSVIADLRFNIYPNPTYGNMTVEYLGSTPATYSISIYNVADLTTIKTLNWSPRIKHEKTELNLLSLKTGLYILRLENSSYKKDFRIQKK